MIAHLYSPEARGTDHILSEQGALLWQLKFACITFFWSGAVLSRSVSYYIGRELKNVEGSKYFDVFADTMPVRMFFLE